MDAAAAAGIRICTASVKLQEVSYSGWFAMAVQVGLIALGCTLLTGAVFQSKHFKKRNPLSQLR